MVENKKNSYSSLVNCNTARLKHSRFSVGFSYHHFSGNIKEGICKFELAQETILKKGYLVKEAFFVGVELEVCQRINGKCLTPFSIGVKKGSFQHPSGT